MSVKDTIRRVFEETHSVNPKHAASLIGERQFGSKWGKEMSADDIASLPWVQLPKEEYVEGVHLPICDYFTIRDTAAMLEQIPNCSQQIELLADMDRSDVQVQVSEHQDKERIHEMVSSKIKARPCSTAWLIVGPAENEEHEEVEGRMIWTAYPGDITARLPPDWDGDIDKLPSLPYAVKAL